MSLHDPLVEKFLTCLDLGSDAFYLFITDLKTELEIHSKITETETDLESLAANIQYWLVKKADFEFLKRSIEKQMRKTSIPQLLELIKKGTYISNKLMDAALESIPDYSDQFERFSKVQYVLDLIHSGVSAMWFKRDALINLSANRRKQIAAEGFEY